MSERASEPVNTAPPARRRGSAAPSLRGAVLKPWFTALVVGAAAVLAVAPTAGAATASKTVTVTSIPALQSAAAAAAPGDRIELADGTYTASGAIHLTRSGTASAPVTVTAQHTGKAEIRGSTGFTFDGGVDFVVLQGFRLTHSGGISIPVGSDHIRFTRNLVQISGSATNWVTVAGNDAEVDHNTFQNKSTEGVFLQISGPGDHDMAQRTFIHHNYFHNHTFSGANGGESIRLGLSGRQLASAHATVENNLFEHADGDPEAISVKSSDNVIRFNTLRDSKGSIVLRHGNRNLVEGNLMLGSTAGIRFYENDHVVINNLIQGGTGQIIAGPGTIADDTANGTEHARPDRVLVAFNTVVGNRADLLDVGTGSDPLGPNDCTFADNILLGGGSGGLVDVGSGTNLHWQGNIVFAGTLGDLPASGGRVVNPALVVDTGGLNRLSSGSPAINAATGSFPQVTRDFDQQARAGVPDVGADELITGGTQRRALTTADVGPNATDIPSTTTRYEAENATISHGLVESDHTGFTGAGFVNYDNATGGFVEWPVTGTAGPATLTLRYANGTTVNRPMTITVNGTTVASGLAFNPTGDWTTWQEQTVDATLLAGANIIRATATTANGGPNADHLDVTQGG